MERNASNGSAAISSAENRFRLAVAHLSTLRARRICLIKPSALGDVVQSLPTIRAIRERFPGASVSWIINDTLAPLVEPAGVVDEIIPFPRDRFRGWNESVRRELLQFGRLLRDRKFDVTIDLQGLFRSAVMSWTTGANIRIGLASSREYSSLAYTHIADDRPADRNAVDRYWSVAELLGVGHLPKEFHLGLTEEELSAARSRLSGLPRPIIAVNPGARWQTKRWPAERFRQLLAQLSYVRPGAAVVVLGGREDEKIAQHVTHAIASPTLNLAGKTTLRELAATLASVDLLLTNDSGPMHLAAALGTRTVSIYTCTSPARSGPFGDGHAKLQTDAPCRASYLKTCDRMICMSDLPSDRLVPLVVHSLSESQSASAAPTRAA